MFVISFPLSSRPALAAFFSKRSSQPGGLFQYSGDGDEIGVKCEDGFLRGSRGRRDGPRCGPPLAKWKRRGLFFAGPFCSAESGGTRFRLRSGNPNLDAVKYIKPEILKNSAIFPDKEVAAKLEQLKELTVAQRRLRNRMWTEIKAGR